jgi:hypothetical protein
MLARGARSIQVREWVENMAPYDRPINWMQHATFGPPFIEPGRTAMDASATRGQVSPGRPGSLSLQPGSAVNWPQGTAWVGKFVAALCGYPSTLSPTCLRWRRVLILTLN